MKSLFLGSILALAVAACVAPSPEPEPQSQPQSQPELQSDPAPGSHKPGEPANLTQGMYSYCVTAGPGRCIVVPLHDGATTECLNTCRAAGFANPRCIYVSIDNWPCSDI